MSDILQVPITIFNESLLNLLQFRYSWRLNFHKPRRTQSYVKEWGWFDGMLCLVFWWQTLEYDVSLQKKDYGRMSSLGMSCLENSLQNNVASVVTGSISFRLLKHSSLDLMFVCVLSTSCFSCNYLKELISHFTAACLHNFTKCASAAIEIGRYCERLFGNPPLHHYIAAHVWIPLEWELRSKDNVILHMKSCHIYVCIMQMTLAPGRR
jgi:hypothetical protein